MVRNVAVSGYAKPLHVDRRQKWPFKPCNWLRLPVAPLRIFKAECRLGFEKSFEDGALERDGCRDRPATKEST
jgi:hypothetical protein